MTGNSSIKIIPTREHAIKVDEVVRCGLTAGVGRPVPGQMCIEAAVCYALGQPHGDEPTCVGSDVRAAKITLNDSEWSSNAARARGMRRIAIAQLGSDGIDQERFRTLLAEPTIREIIPIALRRAADIIDGEHKTALEAAAVRCEAEGSSDAVDAAYFIGLAARSAAANAVAYDVVYNASNAAHLAISDTVYAARCATRTVGREEKDAILIRMANIIERALVACGSPGVEWLDVIPEEN